MLNKKLQVYLQVKGSTEVLQPELISPAFNGPPSWSAPTLIGQGPSPNCYRLLNIFNIIPVYIAVMEMSLYLRNQILMIYNEEGLSEELEEQMVHLHGKPNSGLPMN